MREIERAALFVRIPAAQARALDRLAFESGRSKQTVVSELLARAVESGSGDASGRRVTVEIHDDGGLVVGRHAFRAYDRDVLTLEELAELLSVDPAQIEQLAQTGELPGRKIGDAWRFARSAVLEWLAASSAPEPRDGDR
jgi:excisionase family DNA binding protein